MPIWFRAYNEAIDDRKLKHIARSLGMPKATVLGAWWIILALANNGTERGTLIIDETTPLSRDDLLLEIGEGMDRDTAGTMLDQFLKRDLLMVNGDGIFEVTAFCKRNFTSDSSTERVQRYRQRKQDDVQQDGNGDVTPDETLQQHTETETETETETDVTETESEAEAEADGAVAPTAVPAADSQADILNLLDSYGVESPKREELAGLSWVSCAYLRSWWNYVQSWDKTTADIKLRSFIARVGAHRMPPPEYHVEMEAGP